MRRLYYFIESVGVPGTYVFEFNAYVPIFRKLGRLYVVRKL